MNFPRIHFFVIVFELFHHFANFRVIMVLTKDVALPTDEELAVPTVGDFIILSKIAREVMIVFPFPLNKDLFNFSRNFASTPPP